MKRAMNMGNAYFFKTQLIPIIFFSLLTNKIISQSIATDTLLTNKSKYGLIRLQYLSLYIEKKDTFHTIDSDAVFLTDRKYHPIMKLNSDIFNFMHEDEIDTIKIEEIPLDSLINGVLITRNFSKYCVYANSDYRWGNEGNRLQIWDLKNKNLIFDLYTRFHESSSETKNGKEVTEECGCLNTFKIIGKGVIQINANLNSEEFKPRCREDQFKIRRGKYQYQNGKFVKIQPSLNPSPY